MFERKSSLIASAVIAGLLAGQSVRAEEAPKAAKDAKTTKAAGHEKCDKNKCGEKCKAKNGCGSNGCGGKMKKHEEPKAESKTEEKK